MTAKKAAPPDRPHWFKRALAWMASDGPIYALILIAFGGSLGHGVQVAHKYGQHAAEGWFIAAAVDLFCFVAAKERKRDKNINRSRKGIASMPTIALFIGVALTLAINLKTATPNAWGYVVAGIPGGLLLIVIALLERREGFESKIAEPGAGSIAGVTPNQAANQERDGQNQRAVPVAPEPRTVTANREAAPAARAKTAPAASAAVTFRSEEELQEAALDILTAHKAATGERMNSADLGKALHVSKQRALTIRAEIKDREEAA